MSNIAEDLIGKRFAPSGPAVFGSASVPIWRVKDLFDGSDGKRYARIMNERDESAVKTIVASALKDKRLFRTVT